MLCIHCGKPTKNPKYCSRACSVAHNNSINPKRRLTKQCKKCGELILTTRTFCKKCRRSPSASKTLKDAIYQKHHKSSAFALVRTKARGLCKSRTSCEKCGYSKHVEVAHVKPISSFPLDTLLSVINAPENLIVLCPNCHWEFDHPSTPLGS